MLVLPLKSVLVFMVKFSNWKDKNFPPSNVFSHVQVSLIFLVCALKNWKNYHWQLCKLHQKQDEFVSIIHEEVGKSV